MNLYIKNGIIKKRTLIVIDTENSLIYNPTEDTLFKNGWEVYTPPVADEESVEDYYRRRIIELIRERYSIDDEIAIQRQRYTKPEEFEKYNDYVENCKQQVKEEIGL